MYRMSNDPIKPGQSTRFIFKLDYRIADLIRPSYGRDLSSINVCYWDGRAHVKSWSVELFLAIVSPIRPFLVKFCLPAPAGIHGFTQCRSFFSRIMSVVSFGRVSDPNSKKVYFRLAFRYQHFLRYRYHRYVKIPILLPIPTPFIFNWWIFICLNYR